MTEKVTSRAAVAPKPLYRPNTPRCFNNCSARLDADNRTTPLALATALGLPPFLPAATNNQSHLPYGKHFTASMSKVFENSF